MQLCSMQGSQQLIMNSLMLRPVCVYPSLVRCAKKELKETGILVASVAGAFHRARQAFM